MCHWIERERERKKCHYIINKRVQRSARTSYWLRQNYNWTDEINLLMKPFTAYYCAVYCHRDADMYIKFHCREIFNLQYDFFHTWQCRTIFYIISMKGHSSELNCILIEWHECDSFSLRTFVIWRIFFFKDYKK